MSAETLNLPEEGELVVASVTSVKQNGAYVDLDEYPGVEGFIFIGEIASGWVKNIRGFVREGQRVICKVMRSRKDSKSLELSLKSVSEERKRDRLQEWKNEQRASQLLKVIADKVGWDETTHQQTSTQLVESFGSLYSAFEEAAMQENALTEAGFSGEWTDSFIETAVENIIPPYVEIRGNVNLSIHHIQGVSILQNALLAAEEFTDDEAEIQVQCFYNGAPNYRVEIRAPDFKSAESTWEKATQAILHSMKEAGGSAEAVRD